MTEFTRLYLNRFRIKHTHRKVHLLVLTALAVCLLTVFSACAVDGEKAPETTAVTTDATTAPTEETIAPALLDSLSEPLIQRMADAEGDELINVTIQLKDNIDLVEVDRLAEERAEAWLEENPWNEGLTQQEISLAYQNLLQSQRIGILMDHYAELNEGFLISEGLEDASCGSVGRVIPFISDIDLTKDQILRLAGNEKVVLIEYIDYENMHIVD